MSNKPFRFKQFEIFQDKTAMKVGTDGVLLGSWAKIYSGEYILDIGTGTGLIAMMLAQRFSNAKIDAIEIDKDAFIQAESNFINSIFHDQLKIEQKALQSYSTDKKYNLIVSNPPFFSVNNLIDFDARKQARQQESLTFEELLEKVASLLNEKGVASFIIPYDQKEMFCRIAKNNNLLLNRILYIKGNNESLVKRVLLELSFHEKDLLEDTLVIEEARHQYTKDYISLTKDFYLKM